MHADLSYGEALYQAIDQCMAEDSGVFVYGLGVDDPKGHYGTTKDLHVRYGAHRCFDTPLSEDAMTGLGVGAALAGLRPIHVHQRMDFLLLCMNQLVNMAAKYAYISAGRLKVPFVERACIGRSWGQGAQHSQSLYAMLMHVPGLKVVAPTTPHDAKGCMIAAIRDDNPVIVVEHRMLYATRGLVPKAAFTLPFGEARILEPGSDVTIVAVSHMVVEALRARAHLAKVGISAEVIDPVSLMPLDIPTIAASASRTGHLLVVDNDWLPCGASAEIITRVIEETQGRAAIHVARMGFAEAPCPTTKPLESAFYPNDRTIAAKVYAMLRPDHSKWQPDGGEAPEITAFRGPF
ncbi:MAG: alpha-ketoacid dehydrogenase subunit beta [Rhodospirillaceae bacterium]|nr:alpha-ketoacid dehydrogenase subunit beta [Rhodospirillaceae bacterium]